MTRVRPLKGDRQVKECVKFKVRESEVAAFEAEFSECQVAGAEKTKSGTRSLAHVLEPRLVQRLLLPG